MAQTLRLILAGSVTPVKVAASHVAMFQRRHELAARQFGLCAQPMQQLGKAPFMGIDAAAPIDRLQPIADARVR